MVEKTNKLLGSFEKKWYKILKGAGINKLRFLEFRYSDS